jgi:transcriptional regulator with XRE-family HTH domain
MTRTANHRPPDAAVLACTKEHAPNGKALNGHALSGHALRNANLRQRSLARAREGPPLARALVGLRAGVLGMTRLEFSRRSGISRGTLRDLELGVHTPTRRVLQQFVDFCRASGAPAARLEELFTLYAGAADGLTALIGRLELRAGSPAALARRAAISPATLWAYRRGNFPLPLDVLRRLCAAVEEDPGPAEAVWFAAQRQRFVDRGYPPPLAEFWALCAREGYAEKHLPALGVGMAALRRLRYLEAPAWEEVAGVAVVLCRDEAERGCLERLWRDEQEKRLPAQPDPFGTAVQQLRKKKGLSRRQVADLFGVGGKKPAQVVQSIEEEGCYSARAHPAGLAALLAPDAQERERLLGLWEERRTQFHRRRRPETRLELRLARERYGFEHQDLEPVLGYTAAEYQRIERGVTPLPGSALERIVQAVHRAGEARVEALLRKKHAGDEVRAGWRSPGSVQELVARLADREGGIVPLTRCLRQAGEPGFWAGRLRAVARGEEVPPWPLLQRIGTACGVADLAAVREDWREQYRARLQAGGCSPLGTEVRLVIAETAATVREFSRRLGVHASVLVRDLQRMDRERPVAWPQVERILEAAGLAAADRRREQVYAWWYAADLKA